MHRKQGGGCLNPSINPEDINVLPAEEIRGPNHGVYRNATEPRGLAVILNNKVDRCGSSKDVANIHELLSQIGYEVTGKLSIEEKTKFMEDLKCFREKVTKYKETDSLVVVVMSHGVANDVLLSARDEYIHVNDIYNIFANTHHFAFKGKPKLFIFVYCRGNKCQYQGSKESSNPRKYITYDASDDPDVIMQSSDNFVFFSTMPDFISWRDEAKGTFFIRALVTVFAQKAKDLHISELYMEVNKVLKGMNYEQRASLQQNGVTSTLYLNPIGKDKYKKSQHYTVSKASSQRDSSSESNSDNSSNSNSDDSGNENNEASGGSGTDGGGGSGGGGGGTGDNGDSPMECSEAESEIQTSCSKEAIRIFFFSYLEGCKKDVEDLKERLEFPEYQCKDMTLEPRKSWDSLPKYSGTIVVFFYGYGYGEQIFLGPSNPDTESVSFQVFSLEMKKFQEKGDALILFTNTCCKPKNPSTKENLQMHEPLNDVFHFCTKIIGKCERGSLMTEYLLSMEAKPSIDFEELARCLSIKINSQKESEGDKYFANWRYYGVTENIRIPFLNKKAETKRFYSRDTEILQQKDEISERLAEICVAERRTEDDMETHLIPSEDVKTEIGDPSASTSTFSSKEVTDPLSVKPDEDPESIAATSGSESHSVHRKSILQEIRAREPVPAASGVRSKTEIIGRSAGSSRGQTKDEVPIIPLKPSKEPRQWIETSSTTFEDIPPFKDILSIEDIPSFSGKHQKKLPEELIGMMSTKKYIDIDDRSLQTHIELLQSKKKPTYDSNARISVVIREKPKELLSLLELLADQNLTLANLCLYWWFKNPNQADQATKKAIDFTLQRSSHCMREYTGPATDALCSAIRKGDVLIRELCVSVDDAESLSALSASVAQQKHRLEYLRVCVSKAAAVSVDDRILPLNGATYGVDLVLPDLTDDTLTAVMETAKRLMPTPPDEGFWNICFPRPLCEVSQIIEGLTTQQGLRVSGEIAFPRSLRPPPDEKRRMDEEVKKKTGCYKGIKWGGFIGCGIGIDSW